MSPHHLDDHLMNSATPLRLGTRRSALAMAQSGMVAREVSRVTGRPVELVEITTYGDVSREAIAQIGGTGVFVNALRDALLAGRIDLAVHSLKDLPTTAPEDLLLAAVPEREDVRDALVARDGLSLDELVEKPTGRPVRIGTGSPRRMAQLNAWANARGAALEIVTIRGNVDTRIGYVEKGELDAVVLATAGLNRLGRAAVITQYLEPGLMLPAPGQGALAIECLDTGLAAELAALDHAPTRAAVVAERALLATLEVGCSAPVAALGHIGRQGLDRTELWLEGMVGTTDGTTLLRMTANSPLVLDETAERQAMALGQALAARLLDQGAASLMGERAR